jgi:hypothetical protein
MSNKKLFFLIAGIASILIIVCLALIRLSTIQPKPFAAVQNNQGGCSQCIANNCYSAPCNLECRLVGPDSCETIVMGGGMAGAYSPEVKAQGGDFAEFYLQRVVRNNAAMTAAGIEIGDTLTHVNNQWAESQLKFAELVLTLPKGTTFRGLKKDGSSFFVTL